MAYINFDSTRPFDVIPLGRIAIDFNPIDYFKPYIKKMWGGSACQYRGRAEPFGKKGGLYRMRVG